MRKFIHSWTKCRSGFHSCKILKNQSAAFWYTTFSAPVQDFATTVTVFVPAVPAKVPLAPGLVPSVPSCSPLTDTLSPVTSPALQVLAMTWSRIDDGGTLLPVIAIVQVGWDCPDDAATVGGMTGLGIVTGCEGEFIMKNAAETIAITTRTAIMI